MWNANSYLNAYRHYKERTLLSYISRRGEEGGEWKMRDELRPSEFRKIEVVLLVP